jgi:4-phospho-D-threonate 3-dehydrogenase / 4-phospho-D-erythronate 3-dehydrogenase
MSDRKPAIGIIMGDPAGIGPEITVKSILAGRMEITVKSILAGRIEGLCRPVVIGDARVFGAALSAEKLDLPIQVLEGKVPPRKDPGVLEVLDTKNVDPGKVVIGQASAIGGRAVFEDLGLAIRLAQENGIDGVVAGPHNKYSVNQAGIAFAGYPPLIAQLTHRPHAFNMLVAGSFRIVGVTLHLPLKEVSERITPDLVLGAIVGVQSALERLKIPRPRIAVTGLNPHCGEEGLFGSEEDTAIRPAISTARSKGIDASGPFPADSLFSGIAEKQDYDAYVAMYHDQSHIAIKTVAFERIAGLIIGTPLLVATVGHGTAFEIAGKGIANPGPMIEAVKLVAQSCS